MKQYFYKKNESDKIYWVETDEELIGEILFSFDKKKVFNFFRDYPQELTAEQIKIFKKENPTLAKLKETKEVQKSFSKRIKDILSILK